MKLTKMLAVCAVTTTAIAAMAMSASAAPDATTVTASYTAATDEAPATITLVNVPTRTGTDDATLLVLNTDVFADFDSGASQTVTIAPTQIENINQSANTTDFASIPINALAEGETVYVRMQVDGQIYTAEYTLPVTTPDEPNTVLVGDVNGDGSVTSADATEVLCSTVDLESCIDKVNLNDSYYAAAYCNGDANVTSADATEILCATVDLEHNANVGKDIEIGSIQ